MEKFKLRNKGQEIGTTTVRTQNVKKFKKNRNKYKFLTGTLLAGAIAVSLLSSAQDKDTLKTDDDKLISMDDVNREGLYIIDTSEVDGVIKFVDANYLNENGYMPVDNIDTRSDFLYDCNKDFQLNKDKYDPELLAEFKEKYDNYYEILDLFYDQGSRGATSQTSYILELQEELIKLASKIDSSKAYMPSAMLTDEYYATYFPERETKYTIEYEAQKGDSIDSILNSYVDNRKEYELAKQEFIRNNNVKDEDKIYADDTYTITQLDSGDLEKFGYEIPELYSEEDFAQKHEWINQAITNILVLPGDELSEENKRNLLTKVADFNSRYEKGEFDTAFVMDMQEIENTILQLSGKDFTSTPVQRSR